MANRQMLTGREGLIRAQLERNSGAGEAGGQKQETPGKVLRVERGDAGQGHWVRQ